MSGLPFVARWRNAIRDGDLDATAKFVALTLSTYMNGAGHCYPSKALLAQVCNCAARTVDRAVLRIEAAGYIEVERSRGGRSNRYTAKLVNPVPDDGVWPGADPVTGRPKLRHQRPETPSPVTGESERKRAKASLARADARAGRKTVRASAHNKSARTADMIDDPELLAYDE